MAINKFETQQFLAAPSSNPVLDLYYGTSEKTFEQSSVVEKSMKKPYNPDDLWQKAGDYRIYEEMLVDDQVSVCMQLKVDLVIGSGWDIVSDKEDTQKIADEIYKCLEEDPANSLDEQLEELIKTS